MHGFKSTFYFLEVEGNAMVGRVTAGIIAVGTELAIGQVLDTNSRYIAQRLSAVGCEVREVLVIPDDRVAMLRAFADFASKYRITTITGGLGPTADDFTKEVLLQLFGGELVEDPATLQLVTERLAKRGLALTPRNAEQAMVPSSCEVLPNKLGTAPGMLFCQGENWVFSLPGVPFETESLVDEQVITRVSKLSTGKPLQRVLKIYGIAESYLADRIASWEQRLAEHFSLAYLPSPEGIRLRIDSKEPETPALQKELTSYVDELKSLIPNEFYGEGDETLPSVVGSLLRRKNATVATAESCTAGRLAEAITSVPGASDYYLGGLVTYGDRIKREQLGVNPDLLAQYGAVSEEVARAMALGVMELLKAEYGVATTGLLGPGGDGSKTPVGTFYWAVASRAGVTVGSALLSSTREVNAARATYDALNGLRRVLMGSL